MIEQSKFFVKGPFNLSGWRRWFLVGAWLILVALTQAAVLTWPCFGYFKGNWSGLKRLALIAAVYFFVSAVIVPPLAKQFGRVALPCDSPEFRARSFLFCATNRNYVDQKFFPVLQSLARNFQRQHPETRLVYLDAGFPLAGFPMLPHLSHGDGRKIDFAFYYLDGNGKALDVGGSPIGYFGYVSSDPNVRPPCKSRWWDLRWDFDWLQNLFSNRSLDAERTSDFIRIALKHPKIGKALLEPHLHNRLQLTGPKVKFQGCHAARHDDHVHIQL